MTGRRYKETGRYTYEAFAAAMDYRNPQGGIMPQWEGLTEKLRDAWRQGAHAAIQYGWTGGTPPETPRDWEHAGGFGAAGAWEAPGGDDTRTSHRVR